MRSASLASLLLLLPAAALAQERSVVVEAPLEVTLGDPIDVLITVTAAAGDEVAVPDQSFAPFEILEKKTKLVPQAEGNATTFDFELRMVSFALGEHTLGPIQVRITTEGGDLIVVESETKTVAIESVLANEPDPDLKPPTAPVAVEQDDYRLLIALGALAALALGALLAWFFLRWWQRRERPDPPAPPPPPPWEIALAELRAHEQSREAALAEGRTEPWVDAVSDSIRSYLGRRYGFQGLESTTDEIATALARSKSLSIQPAEAVDLLAQCDLVKFARASLADDASRTLLKNAFSLVERTRPRAAADSGESA